MSAFPSAITTSNAAPLLGLRGTPGLIARPGEASWESLARGLETLRPVSGRAEPDTRKGLTISLAGLGGSGFSGRTFPETDTKPAPQPFDPVDLFYGKRPDAEKPDELARPGDKMSPAQARKAAEEFVSISLVQPILAQLRKTNQAYGVFAPGEHEKQFGPLMDAEIAMRMTRASNFPLVDAVARNLQEFGQRALTKDATNERSNAPGPNARSNTGVDRPSGGGTRADSAPDRAGI
jgi:Rod binding domain-containing protein